VVGDHHGDRHVEFASAVAPQQIEHAVVGLGDHDRHPFRLGRFGEREFNVESVGHVGGEGSFQLVAGGGQAGQVEFGALEEGAAGLGSRVLGQRHDVGARIGQEGADGRHDAGPVLAADEEPAVVGAVLRGRCGALLRLRPEDSTVTQVASDVGGFFHLGRFAREYLAMFGEHPSGTLHRQAG
jgi:hypothetical protein